MQNGILPSEMHNPLLVPQQRPVMAPAPPGHTLRSKAIHGRFSRLQNPSTTAAYGATLPIRAFAQVIHRLPTFVPATEANPAPSHGKQVWRPVAAIPDDALALGTLGWRLDAPGWLTDGKLPLSSMYTSSEPAFFRITHGIAGPDSSRETSWPSSMRRNFLPLLAKRH